MSCHGVDDVDKEHVSEFRYYPQGFASYYYPYRNYKNYLSPILAVEIVKITRKYPNPTLMSEILSLAIPG